ncbi:MAG: redoxin domain-containing protein [Planctomycetes bacterium]|nr:redoxin domain-containing protein [Planctomycetota bacterium]
MRERLSDLENAGAQLIAVDPHEAWPAKHFLREVGIIDAGDVRYPLLLDPAQVVSAAYGVTSQMRIHTELSNRPTTFIIDCDGVIRYERRAKTFSDRPTPDEILAELQKLR